MQIIPIWTRFEASFACSHPFDNPVQEVAVSAEFTSPSGRKRTAPVFWDGESTWRVRFLPDELGTWSVRTQTDFAGLDGKTAGFECVPYTGHNPLYRHGALRVAANGRYFEHADGTPFFWLGDTVWNGPLKATLPDWSYFLADRAAKGFNLIQFVPTQWVAGAGNADLRHAFSGKDSIRIDPVFFHWLDKRVDAINEFGMVACPAAIWAAPSKDWALPLNPGTFLGEDQICVLARYLVARYGAHHAVWMLAGDGDYAGEKAARWKRIGRKVFTDDRHLVTMHPWGRSWVGEEFRSEPWFSFHGYQSSHRNDDCTRKWITEGPPGQDWKTEPVRPIVNLEPCYEAHLDMAEPALPDRKPFDAQDVRNHCFWSLLASPTAGVTYGCHGVWGWELLPQLPMNHVRTGVAPPWFEAMKLPGSAGMKHLKDLFLSIEWWRLEPAADLLKAQPGVASSRDFVSAARSDCGDLAMFYLPRGGEVAVRTSQLRGGLRATWISGESGERLRLSEPVPATENIFVAPGPGDWTLLLAEAR